MRAAAALALAAPLLLGQAKPVLVPDVSQREVEIAYSFTGAELLLFGAILYPGGRVPERAPDVVVVVKGPTESITIREKEKVAGVWVNATALRYRSAPSFYAAASSRPIRDMGSYVQRLQNFVYTSGTIMTPIIRAAKAAQSKRVAYSEGEEERVPGHAAAAAAGQATIVHGTGQQMEGGGRQHRPFGVDIALPVGHHGDAPGLRQDGLGRRRGVDPAPRLLVGQRTMSVVDLDASAAARGHRARYQTQAAATVCIDRQHGMQQGAPAPALADLAQPAPALGPGREVDLAGVLDRQHVTTRR